MLEIAKNTEMIRNKIKPVVPVKNDRTVLRYKITAHKNVVDPFVNSPRALDVFVSRRIGKSRVVPVAFGKDITQLFIAIQDRANGG